MASRFFWLGNDLGLDFLNTEAVDGRGDPLDLLTDPDALFEWADEAGLVDPADTDACRRLPPRSQRSMLAWARRLRSGLRAMVDPAGDRADDDAALLSAVVAEVPIRLTVPSVSGGARPPVPVGPARPADRLRLALALAALDTLHLERGRIRRCEGRRCVLVYYDTSRNRSRRWCDMASCGNRAKAAAHYRRLRDGRGRAGANAR